jgi:hypothetical protein
VLVIEQVNCARAEDDARRALSHRPYGLSISMNERSFRKGASKTHAKLSEHFSRQVNPYVAHRLAEPATYLSGARAEFYYEMARARLSDFHHGARNLSGKDFRQTCAPVKPCRLMVKELPHATIRVCRRASRFAFVSTFQLHMLYAAVSLESKPESKIACLKSL